MVVLPDGGLALGPLRGDGGRVIGRSRRLEVGADVGLRRAPGATGWVTLTSHGERSYGGYDDRKLTRGGYFDEGE